MAASPPSDPFRPPTPKTVSPQPTLSGAVGRRPHFRLLHPKTLTLNLQSSPILSNPPSDLILASDLRSPHLHSPDYSQFHRQNLNLPSGRLQPGCMPASSTLFPLPCLAGEDLEGDGGCLASVGKTEDRCLSIATAEDDEDTWLDAAAVAEPCCEVGCEAGEELLKLMSQITTRGNAALILPVDGVGCSFQRPQGYSIAPGRPTSC